MKTKNIEKVSCFSIILWLGLFINNGAFGQQEFPDCNDLLVTSIVMDDDTANLMKVTIYNSCDSCTSGCAYWEVSIVRSISPFDIIAANNFCCLQPPPNNSSATFGITSNQTYVPPYGTYFVLSNCGCDTIPINPYPTCNDLLVTETTVHYDSMDSEYKMNITISNSCDSCEMAIYRNLVVVRTIPPYDTIALEESSTVSPPNNGTHIYSIPSYQATVPLSGTYRIGMSGVCDSISVSPAVGLAEHNIDHLTFIYPNPTKDKIRISTDFEFEYEIKITDIRGSIIYKSVSTGKSNSVDITGFTSGIYFITLSDKHGRTATKKIIKE